MARDYSLEYDERSKKLKVWEKGELRLFRNISQEEYNRLNNGLRNNPGSGYLHFNAFLNRNFDKEVGGEYDQAYAEYKASQYKEEEKDEIGRASCRERV